MLEEECRTQAVAAVDWTVRHDGQWLQNTAPRNDSAGSISALFWPLPT